LAVFPIVVLGNARAAAVVKIKHRILQWRSDPKPVLGGKNVLIGGFIVSGTTPKKLIGSLVRKRKLLLLSR